MLDDDLKREARKQARLEALDSNDPACAMCGESDWRCMELHHVAGQQHDAAVVCLCRNCHRKVSDDQRDYPPIARGDPMLDSIGRFLRGLADMLRVIVERLYAFSALLIEQAALQ
ncbi:hypothetical protein OK349_15450 [Sphingomonas sp. BT-65]|uniref:hypothetical protein n=1 Tax=Sphingomonas sp. BT-65 TaxID=2989821 RepID=UPI002236AC7A|nr:hypothetical protein [Sphingomonas sp. BT-65]MCW4463109.1 hypothetical protein [Sphingomonas sp. BT-65]